jgi:hypothetical protein
MTSKTIQRDIERLDEEIARSRRMVTYHEGDDDYLAEAYERDAEDLQAVRDAAARGDLAEAGRLAYHLDTYVRDEIPKRFYNAIMKAAGFSG